ncbi:hypothetical protein PILCRDRAFT_426443 [Piloderma croceum F 1598]|uniref:Uncharacterized protein n=1 Tax=Piloderma croceum (strain F 1598) TaxID=765440 RepID=A0A0C3FYY1_PILCF|nr:hypothetical protein PILCRDRAFT_426443 [Piloderma croceum F 1598]
MGEYGWSRSRSISCWFAIDAENIHLASIRVYSEAKNSSGNTPRIMLLLRWTQLPSTTLHTLCLIQTLPTTQTQMMTNQTSMNLTRLTIMSRTRSSSRSVRRWLIRAHEGRFIQGGLDLRPVMNVAYEADEGED